DPPAEVRREHLLELDERTERGVLAESLDGRHPQADGDRHGLVVVEEERWEVGAGRELVPAVDPGAGEHLVAELAQPVDVAAQGAVGDPETLAQLAPRPGPVRLEEGEQPEGAGGGIGHVGKSTRQRGQDLTASAPNVVPMTPIISTRGLSKTFRRQGGEEVVAVSDLTMDIADGS